MSILNEKERGLTYGFEVHDSWCLEAHSVGNLMRFANHTGVKYANCHIHTYISEENTHHLCLYSKETIEAGSELVFNYGMTSDMEWLVNYEQRYFINI